MVKIDENDDKYTVKFKQKDKRVNKTDDKVELFRQAIGLEDTSNILDLKSFTGNKKTSPIIKDKRTITDVNNYNCAFVIARLTPEQVIRLRKDPNVEYVAEDGIAFAAAQVTGWNITKVKAPAAWASPLSAKGVGVIIAIVDTGVDSQHIDLKANIKINQSFIDTDPTTISKDSPNFHGTHVAGIAGALDNSEGVVGVAPGATLWNLRAGDANGLFKFTDTVEAIEYAKSNGAHIINASLGAIDTHDQPTADSIKDGYDNDGIIFCGSEGNNGKQSSTNYISRYYGVLGVSNLQENNTLHGTSNYGPNTDFTLPGTNINSTKNGNAYQILTGTSMSCPALSGLCALALSAYRDTGCPPYTPGLKRNKVIESALKMSVNKLGAFTTERDNRYGYGLPEADKLIQTMKGITG
jgi:subtilisin